MRVTVSVNKNVALGSNFGFRNSENVRKFCDRLPEKKSGLPFVTTHIMDVVPFQSSSTRRKVFSTALCAIPPTSGPEFNKVQVFRQEHDKKFDEWAPHVNVMYPFIPEKEFSDNINMLQFALQSVSPFTATFSTPGFFEGNEKGTGLIFLYPNDEARDHFIHIHKIVKGIFPDWNSVNFSSTPTPSPSPSPVVHSLKNDKKNFVPHLTIASYTNVEQREQLIQQITSENIQITWNVSHLQIVSQDSNTSKYQIKYTIPLLGKTTSGPLPVTSSAIWCEFPSYKYSSNENKWVPFSSNVPTEASELTILEYNVLFDLYMKDKSVNVLRIPKLLKEIEISCSDIIVLCEVTPPFLEKLLSETWVQKDYYISDHGGITVSPYGQLILSKHPLTILNHTYSQFKRAIIGVLSLNGRTFYVPAIHLTSDTHRKSDPQNISEKRAKYFSVIYQRTCPSFEDDGTDCAFVGDFNIGDGEDGENFLFQNNDVVDCWKFLSEEFGFTFDPQTNLLASQGSENGRRRRIDRILLRSHFWQPEKISLVGTTPFEVDSQDSKKMIHPSDHFGVKCVLKFLSEPVPKKDSTKQNYENFENLENSSERNLQDLQQKISQVDLTELVFSKLKEPSEEQEKEREKAVELVEVVLREKIFGKEDVFQFHPIGSYALKVHSENSDIDCVCVGSISREQFYRKFKSIPRIPNFKIVKITLDARIPVIRIVCFGILFDLLYAFMPILGTFKNNTPTTTNSSSALPNSTNNDSLPSSPPPPSTDTTPPSDSHTSTTPSTSQTAHSPSPFSSPSPFLSSSSSPSPSPSPAPSPSPSPPPSPLDISTIPDASLSSLSPPCLISLNGFRDVVFVLEKVLAGKKNGKLAELFRKFVKVIYFWAKKKDIYSSKLGFLGGYGWNVLVIRVFQLLFPNTSEKSSPNTTASSASDTSETSDDPQLPSLPVLLYKFFNYYASWNWNSSSVSVICDPPVLYRMNPTKDKISVVTMNRPYQNSCRNSTYSTRKILEEAFTEARDAIIEGNWENVFKPSIFFRKYENYLQITIEAVTTKEFQMWLGWIESRIVELIIQIERRLFGMLVQPCTLRFECGNSTFPFSCQMYLSIFPEFLNSDEDKFLDDKQQLVVARKIVDFESLLNSWPQASHGMAVSIKQLKRKEIPSLKLAQISTFEEDDEEEETRTSLGETTGISLGDFPSKRAPKNAATDAKKNRLRSSEEIYNRIKWDPTFDVTECLIGYEDRFAGIQEIELNLFRHPSTDFIPYHRVWYFKYKGKIVWDRENRLDLL